MNTLHDSLVAERRTADVHLRVHLAGTGALLLDVSGPTFNAQAQQRLRSLVRLVTRDEHASDIHDVVPGVNNLMLVFDPLKLCGEQLASRLIALWFEATADDEPGRVLEVPVVYGGSTGEDLDHLAQSAGLSVVEVVRRHSSALYTVISLGAMPGFAYLSGLPPELALPRRTTPRARAEKGSVIIGGSQAAVLPSAGPCGWHVLGTTDLTLFDLSREPVCLLAPGDQVRFAVQAIEPAPPAQAAS